VAESTETLSGVSLERLIPAARGSSEINAVHRGVASPPSAPDVIGDHRRQVGMNVDQSARGMPPNRLDAAAPPIFPLRDVASGSPPLHENIPGTDDPLQPPDYASGALRNLEMSIEINRSDDPAKEDARYLLQPYYIAANVHHFNKPAKTLAEVAP
jgi:hypothetical protein